MYGLFSSNPNIFNKLVLKSVGQDVETGHALAESVPPEAAGLTEKPENDRCGNHGFRYLSNQPMNSRFQ